jgi:hypothetical protein
LGKNETEAGKKMNKIKYAIYAGIESLILIPLGIFCLFGACVYFAWEKLSTKIKYLLDK